MAIRTAYRLLARPGTVLGLLALVIATAGFALAANPSSDGTITACVNKKTKALRLANSRNRCKRTETRLRWNQVGQQGAAGQNGQNGANNSCVVFYEGSTRLGGGGCVASAAYTRGHGSITVAADSGSHTYSVRYQSPAATLASFQNRTLVVSVIR